MDRKTAQRFAHAVTSDDAVAISRPTVLDRYHPHLHRRWHEGCHDAAVLHAEITQLGYRGSLRTGYRYLQPLRAGAAPWLKLVEADDQPELHTFDAGILHDLAAVTAWLTPPYSSGPTEGNVNRLKAIKRQMYGRASLDLLRKRVIHHPRNTITEIAPEPITLASDHGPRHDDPHIAAIAADRDGVIYQGAVGLLDDRPAELPPYYH